MHFVTELYMQISYVMFVHGQKPGTRKVKGSVELGCYEVIFLDLSQIVGLYF